MSETVTTMCAAFQRIAAARPGGVAVRAVGDTQILTWSEYATRVRDVTAGLHGLGIRRSDTVALMMSNRVEFYPLEIAAQHVGATSYSVYATSSPAQLAHSLSNSGARLVFCEAEYVDRVREAGPDVEHIVCVNDGGPSGTLTVDDVVAAADPEFDFEASWRAVRPDDVLTLVYTSGTTGLPKGVEMTHANLVAQTELIGDLWGDVTHDDRVLSYLPSAHIADRVSALYLHQMRGITITVVPDITQFPAALADARPTVFGAVPRVWEKLRVGISMKLAAETDPDRKRGLDWAMDVARSRGDAELAHEAMSEELAAEWAKADAAVLGMLRRAVGIDKVKYALSGAAPVAPKTLAFFAGLGVPVVETWGMSESSAVVTGTSVADARLGTVGRAVGGMELRLGDDGELIVRGPMVMKGYRGDPANTAEAIDADGWLYTGDIATIDDDGYVRIVDRKKDIMINAAGKNMAPALIENPIKASTPLIGAIAVIGEARPYTTAVIVLDPEVAAHLAPGASAAELAANPAVVEAVATGIGLGNASLSRVEQVKRFRILPVFWEPGGDELTPTMKTKRKPISAKYADEIAELYADPRPVAVHEPMSLPEPSEE